MKDPERRSMEAAALSRARHALARATGKRRLDIILDQENPAALVRALPGDELFLAIQEIGLGDAVELVQLASPGQFRTFLDLACWPGERVEPRRMLPWLRAARADSLQSAVGAARWRAKLAAIDVELLHLALRDMLRVHDLEQDPDPHIESDHFMRTPDEKFVIEFRAEGAQYAAIRGLVDDLYAEDPFRATRLLASIQWDLPSELEETALRWRTGRLADLGYPSRQEALSWFTRPASGTTPPSGTPDRPAGFFLERIGAGSLLARAAASLRPEEREHLELEMVSAANAILVADAVDPGDLEAVRGAVAAGRAFVEMGLEQLADTDARAAEVLATTAVKALFQRGFGRVLELKWRAERLFAGGRAGTRDAPFLDPPLGEAIGALARRRPLYFPGLETAREEWGSVGAGAFEPRGFSSSAEVSRTAEALALAEELVELAGALGLAPDEARRAPEARLSTMYLTALANERLGRPFAPDPIPEEELRAAAMALSDVDPARLAEHGRGGAILEQLARTRAGELAHVREGGRTRPEHVTALLVRA
jgi:hypothetical protein